MDKKKIEIVTRRIAFLMEHQRILPELKDLVTELQPDTEYMAGAIDALTSLITSLEEKNRNME